MNLAFLWHMHQPDYRNADGVMQMPWVFLHAIKDYYDMPWMLERHGTLKATFNITPPLIAQLKLYYENPEANDKFFALWLRDISSYNRTEYRWVLKICKSAHFETMVAGFESYERLYKQESYTNAEFFDLQVWFLLSWCGVYLRQNSSVVQEMLEREGSFSLDDKHALLHELTLFVQGIFDYYVSLKERDIISISTTPLNHPILPLLLDMQNAKIANESTNTPKYAINLEEDALLQIKRAQELFVDTFGFQNDGFWPAEGAVDVKSAALFKKCGASWIATDEEILFRSSGTSKRELLYAPYEYNGLAIAFRDHELSDLIGFNYRFFEPHHAADDFISRLQNIHKKHDDATVFIILDGENAWEFYKNNGFDFFDALYGSLKIAPFLQTLHMQDVLELTKKPLEHLAAGSWINGEFNTWVGHREKTRAWEFLYITKRDYEHHQELLDSATQERITKHFLAAECSDWFWWYGDDHFTEFGLEFDALFRSHLLDIYTLMQVAPPQDLLEPIIQNRSSSDFLLQPQSFLSPTISGKHGSFFEWIGSGVINEHKSASTMDLPKTPIKKILYGYDEQNLYFAFIPHKKAIKECEKLRIIIDPIGFSEELTMEEKNHITAKSGDVVYEAAYDTWLEARIEKAAIKEQKISLRFEVLKDGTVVQTLPGFGVLEIDIKCDFSERWFV